MGFLEELMGKRNAESMQKVYDRTALAANQMANQGMGAIGRGMNEVDRIRQANMEKQKNGTMLYDELGQSANNMIDMAKQKAMEVEAYRQANLSKQGRSDPVDEAKSWMSGFGKYFG